MDFYNRAEFLAQLPSVMLFGVLNKVAFAAFSRASADRDQLRRQASWLSHRAQPARPQFPRGGSQPGLARRPDPHPYRRGLALHRRHPRHAHPQDRRLVHAPDPAHRYRLDAPNMAVRPPAARARPDLCPGPIRHHPLHEPQGRLLGQCPQGELLPHPQTERVHHRVYATRHHARRDLFGHIEGFYNPRRLHSSLGYISPVEAERRAASPRPLLRDKITRTRAPSRLTGSRRTPSQASPPLGRRRRSWTGWARAAKIPTSAHTARRGRSSLKAPRARTTCWSADPSKPIARAVLSAALSGPVILGEVRGDADAALAYPRRGLGCRRTGAQSAPKESARADHGDTTADKS